MHHEHRRTIEGADPDVVRAQLGRRPASWLRPFLRLATTGGLAGGSTPVVARAPEPWYRLSAPDPDGTMRFVWHPHQAAPVFRSFSGSLRCEPDGSGAALVVRGHVAEGEPAATDQVLGTLLDLLAVALGEAAHSG